MAKGSRGGKRNTCFGAEMVNDPTEVYVANTGFVVLLEKSPGLGLLNLKNGAGDGNRTRILSLGS